jgi:hypothetical protein
MTGADSALPIWADFMTAALAAHPEWGGDWETPAGVEQAAIDPKTGLLAAEDSPTKRVEFFVQGTAPTQTAEPLEDDPLLPEETPLVDDTLPPPGEMAVPPLPEETPAPRQRNAPGLEGRGTTNPDGSTRLTGTVTLDVDPTTGLIAADTCPVIRTRTFAIGSEPRRRCGPQYHTGQVVIPSETRPRRAAPRPDNR